MRFLNFLSLALLFIPFRLTAQNFEWLQWSPVPGISSDYDHFNAIATDPFGNTYMAVQFEGILAIGSYSFQSNPIEDICILKYDADGQFIWAKAFGSLYWDQVNGMDCDENGNVYLTGHYFGNLWYEDQTLVGNAGGREMFLMKIQPDGTVAWAVNGANIWNEEGTDVRAMPGGGVVMSGRANNTAYIGNLQVNNPDYFMQEFIAYFDENGQGQWIRSCGPSGNPNEYYSNANLEIGPDSSIYIGYTGYNEIVFNGDTLRPWYYPQEAYTSDLIIQRWSPEGEGLWCWIGGSMANEIYGDIGVDQNGRVYAGVNMAMDSYFNNNLLNVEPDYWSTTILRFQPDGVEDTAWHFISPSFSIVQSCVVDGSDNIWFGGTLRDSLYMGNLTLTTPESTQRHGYLGMINGSTNVLERTDLITGLGWRTVAALDYNPVSGNIQLGGSATAGPQGPAIYGLGEDIVEGFAEPGNWAYLASYDGSTCAELAELTISDSLICPGESATLSYPNEVFFPLWNTGDETISISVNTAINAAFSAIDSSGCVIHLQSEIAGAEAMTFEGSITNLQCNNSGDGAIDIEILSGQEPIVISWSSGQDTEDLSDLAAGTYHFTATSAQGCTTTELFNVTQPAVINGTIAEADSVLTLSNVTGGTPPYTYVWNEFVNETGSSVSITEAGSYSVTITDSNGCTNTETILATAIQEVRESIVRIAPNPSQGSFIVSFNRASMDQVTYFTIENSFGQVIREEKTSQVRQVIELPVSGHYILRFRDNNGQVIQTERVIIL